MGSVTGIGPIRTILAIILTGFVASTIPRAHAQDLGRLTQPAVQQGPDKTTKPAPAPAVPGSKPVSGAAADEKPQPDHPALDLPPTEALFDAINRGDIASAKDAIGRGADLSAQNVLGLTPLDLSVDLGRNDISFLLLSLRPVGTSPPRAVASAPANPQGTGRSGKTSQPAVAREVVKAAPATRTPQLFAGDGGAAVPQAGFLGFGGARSSP